MRRAFYALIGIVLATSATGATDLTPAGAWLHDNKRIQIKIAPCGDELCGNIVWFKKPNDALGDPLADVNNQNPELRSRPLLGLTVLRGLRRTGNNTWVGGRIYNPDDGVDYQAQMSIRNDGNLDVRAYLLLPALGKTLIWTPVR